MNLRKPSSKVPYICPIRINQQRDMISGDIDSRYRFNDDIRRLQLIVAYAELFLRPHIMRHRERGLSTETVSSASTLTVQKKAVYISYKN